MRMAHAPPGHHSIVGRPSTGGLTYPEYVVYRGEQVRLPRHRRRPLTTCLTNRVVVDVVVVLVDCRPIPSTSSRTALSDRRAESCSTTRTDSADRCSATWANDTKKICCCDKKKVGNRLVAIVSSLDSRYSIASSTPKFEIHRRVRVRRMPSTIGCLFVFRFDFFTSKCIRSFFPRFASSFSRFFSLLFFFFFSYEAKSARVVDGVSL